MDHIVSGCQIYQSPHGIYGLANLDDDTLKWLDTDTPCVMKMIHKKEREREINIIPRQQRQLEDFEGSLLFSNNAKG